MTISENTPITENFSEIKRKVGRPKKQIGHFTDKEMEFAFDSYKGLCNRSQKNKKYFMISSAALGFNDSTHPCKFNPEYEFLFPWVNNGLKQGKNTILYALGRIDDDDLIRALATKICENKLTAKQAREYIKLVLSKLKEQEEGASQ